MSKVEEKSRLDVLKPNLLQILNVSQVVSIFMDNSKDCYALSFLKVKNEMTFYLKLTNVGYKGVSLFS